MIRKIGPFKIHANIEYVRWGQSGCFCTQSIIGNESIEGLMRNKIKVLQITPNKYPGSLILKEGKTFKEAGFDSAIIAPS